MDELLKLMVQAAEKFGVESARVWPQMVAVTYAMAWVKLLTVLGGIVGFSVLAVQCTRKYIDESEGAILFIWVIPSLLLLGLLVSLGDIVTGIVAPEVQTIKELIPGGR